MHRNKPIEVYTEKFGMKLTVLVALCLYAIKLSSPLVKWWKLHYIITNNPLHALTIYATLLVFMALYIHGIVILIRTPMQWQRIINV
jgi:hypothetical protein